MPGPSIISGCEPPDCEIRPLNVAITPLSARKIEGSVTGSTELSTIGLSYVPVAKDQRRVIHINSAGPQARHVHQFQRRAGHMESPVYPVSPSRIRGPPDPGAPVSMADNCDASPVTVMSPERWLNRSKLVTRLKSSV